MALPDNAPSTKQSTSTVGCPRLSKTIRASRPEMCPVIVVPQICDEDSLLE